MGAIPKQARPLIDPVAILDALDSAADKAVAIGDAAWKRGDYRAAAAAWLQAAKLRRTTSAGVSK